LELIIGVLSLREMVKIRVRVPLTGELSYNKSNHPVAELRKVEDKWVQNYERLFNIGNLLAFMFCYETGSELFSCM